MNVIKFTYVPDVVLAVSLSVALISAAVVGISSPVAAAVAVSFSSFSPETISSSAALIPPSKKCQIYLIYFKIYIIEIHYKLHKFTHLISIKCCIREIVVHT